MHTRLSRTGLKTALRFPLVAALLAAVLAAPSRAPAAETRPWNRSGKRHTLASLEGRSTPALSGGFSWLCSAKRVRALALQRDTLWIGTEGGLFAMSLALDMIEPVRGPASPSIHALVFDNAGTLWAGGDKGASARSGGKWRHYTADSDPLFQRIRCFVRGEGRLWIGSFGGGTGYVAGDAVTVVAHPDSIIDRRVLSIAELSATTYYTGTPSGLMLADTSEWRSLRYGSHLPIGAVRCLAFDEEGDLFCSIAGQGVAVYSFGRVRAFGTGPGTPGANVYAFSIDPSSRRMWAAGDDGAFVFDGTEWSLQELRGLGGARPRFLSMQHDAEGNCYLGTDDGRIVVITRGGARAVAVPQSFPAAMVPRIRVTAGTTWCIAGSGVLYSREIFAQAAQPPEPYGREMTDFLPLASGELWVATRFGILRAAGRKWDIFDRRTGLATEYFTRIARDPGGTLWFASADAGVYAHREGSWTRYTRANGLPEDETADLVVDGAGIPWIVTRGGEVARFAQGVWQRVPLSRRVDTRGEADNGADSLRRYDPAIRFLGESRGGPAPPGIGERWRLGLDRAGNCLVATGAGVHRMTAAGFVFVELPNRFRSVRPTAVIGTSRGELWLGTAGSGLFVHRGNEWLRLTGSNGLSDDFVRSLVEDDRGNVWIGTQSGGLTKYAPAGGS